MDPSFSRPTFEPFPLSLAGRVQENFHQGKKIGGGGGEKRKKEKEMGIKKIIM